MKRLLGQIQGSFPGRLAAAYGESQAGNYAAGLAFNAFTSMFPLILGVLAIAGFFIHDPVLEEHLRAQIVGLFPPDAQPQLLKALTGVKENAGLLGLVSLFGLLYAGSNLFSSMEFALAQVFGSKQRDLLRQKAMAMFMMLIFVVALVASLAITAAAALVTQGANALLNGPVSGLVAAAVGVLAAGIVMVALLIAIYRVVPNRTFGFGEIWPGALLAGACIAVLNLVWRLYAQLSHGWNTYGAQFALFFVLATWLYFLCQFILLGAILNRMRQGAPDAMGLVAAPGGEGTVVRRPVEAIERRTDRQPASPTHRKQAPAPHVSAPPRPPRGVRGVVEGVAVFGVVVLAPVIRLLRSPGREHLA